MLGRIKTLRPHLASQRGVASAGASILRLHQCAVRLGSTSAPTTDHAAPSIRDGVHTDIRDDNWVQRLLPASAWPYASLGRWDRPIGTWLLLWPCLWSTALAAPAGSLPDASLCALFGIGAFAMRGAGCTVNDLWDRDIDRQVERTRSRPLASGALSVSQGVAFFFAQSSVGLAVLLALPPYAVGASILSVPLVCLYPLAKRVTDWPQAMLGFTFNWGAIVGWAAVHGECYWPAVAPLYASGIFWTLAYDTIYAHQDKADDARIGVRSTALRLGDGAHARAMLGVFAATSVASFAASAHAAGVHPVFYAALAGGAGHLGWQVLTVDFASPADCLRKFQSNTTYGLLLFAGIVVGKIMLEPSSAEEGSGLSSSADDRSDRPSSASADVSPHSHEGHGDRDATEPRKTSVVALATAASQCWPPAGVVAREEGEAPRRVIWLLLDAWRSTERPTR